ncbi:hypothetical protein SERLA73DRAFT_72245 [Serpula lacrymans var. lacrymans S7.3]|uniref:DHHA2 domain-containing protein n=2 Tax=Serpula lacrymans var. lacrymans TaxID=341189 RepID=F8PSG7_SERL3|nr:uncharacterized protein SERLADRAFT_436756 [Serpula lacrymans var. lacrymans S7.9]EGO01297.1 hypothetical protein SERLA73DRAFT_72245 [Serpula lacrymans var. lacrymans S7.3]EGO26938.1 hypothetical protein SERLADRAFT_436756 [Serpula lacrymans var. lacrymans S7.9]
MSTLSQYLSSHKSRYLKDIKNGKGRNWTVVIGNEAGDLDSVASCIAYSWVRTEVHQQLTIPLIRTKRPDFVLRAENTHALSLAGIESNWDELLCQDDLQWDQAFPSNKFALVDHNSLHSEYLSHNDGAQVVAIVDHHDDEQKYKDSAHPRIIAPSGSCASHIAHLCPPNLLPELANLLLCAILVDTNGLVAGGKALQVDHDAVVFLIPQSTLLFLSFQPEDLPNMPELNDLSGTLRDKKNSVSHLQTRDLLRRDYKEYEFVPSWAPSKSAIHAGMSTVPLGFKRWIFQEQELFFSSTKEWMEERDLSVLGILTTFRRNSKKSGKSKHKREMMWIIRDTGAEGAMQTLDAQELSSRVWSGFEGDPELRLKNMAFEDFGVHHAMIDSSLRARIYKQKNSDATRKTSAPILRRIMEGPSAQL